MATGFGTLRTAAGVGASGLIHAALNGGVKKSYTERFDLASADFEGANGDMNLVAKIPEGEVITGITVQSSVSLTTSTLSFGTAVDPDLYAAAKAYGTTVNAEVKYPVLAAVKGVPLDGLTAIYMAIAAANLPAAGIVVVEIETSTRG